MSARLTLTAVWKAHPRLPSPATILCIGDSNTAGAGGATPWVSPLATLAAGDNWTVQVSAGGGFSVTDHGTPGGVIIGDINFWLGSNVISACAQAQKPTAIIMSGITNDFRVPPVMTPLQVVTELEAQQRSCQAAGIDYFVTLCPRNFPTDTTLNPGVNDLARVTNDLIRERFPAHHIDFYAATPLQSDYQADGVHMTTSGQAVRAEVAYGMLKVP